MKPERFTAGVFIFVIGALMLLVFFSIGSKAKELSDNPKIKIEWEKIYPFEGGIKAPQAQKESFYDYVKSRLSYISKQQLLYRYKIVESAKKYENALGWNMVSISDYNAVIKLKDGYLTSYTISLDVTQDAEAVKGLSEFCAERGIGFMYINFPEKICVSEDKEISGVLDFANQNADKFLAMLKDSGVKNYDLRKNLHEAGMNHHEAFFVTDNHWKTETGLWAAGEILKILRDDWGWNVKPEILSPENFEFVIYRDWYLGAHGKKMTLARAKPEDFTMIYPEFETNLHIQMPAVNVNSSGDFTAFYDMSQLKEKDFYKLSCYAAYTYYNHPLITSDNELSSNTKRLLVIRDSFSDCVVPFLSLGVRHLDAIDLRQFTGSVKRFIESEKPDVVIVQYNSAMLGISAEPSATKETKKLYDFR